MFAVIFEVNPRPEQWDSYLGYARSLRPELERIDGFIDNERFSSLRREGWVLSLSIWQDENAVVRWRSAARHHQIQHKGRSEIFRDYHLRVGEIVADSQLPTSELRAERLDETQAEAKLVALSEAALSDLPPQPDAETVAARLGVPDIATQRGLLGWDAFASIYDPSKYILLTSWRNATAVAGWPPPGDASIRHRRVRIIRDYGMFDRAEAPQYFPPVSAEQSPPPG